MCFCPVYLEWSLFGLIALESWIYVLSLRMPNFHWLLRIKKKKRGNWHAIKKINFFYLRDVGIHISMVNFNKIVINFNLETLEDINIIRLTATL